MTDPQGRNTVTRYLDNTRKVEVWSDLNSSNDALLKSRSTHDQLGRVVKTEAAEDGVNYTIFADSVYQQGGRITIATNPMRTAGATTDGWTRTTRDDLGRVVTVETLNERYPAGTSTGLVTTTYTPDATTLRFAATVTDQVGKVRRSITDGLGRLTRVDEPNSSNDPGPLATPVQPTSYTYDAVDNLTSVTQIQGNPQATQTRTFSYDSLKRLKQAVNPESGTINYTYDDNSNLQTKTDARGVITTYAYDGLNRVTTRTYSGQAPGPTTPNVTYVYDTLGASVNGKGRLTSVSSSVSSYSYGSYDVVGRVLTGTQTTDNQLYAMSYQYNLAGGMTSETYPSNKVVATEYDAAGRIAGVKKDATIYYAGGTPSTSNAMSYTAHGAPATMKLGNGKWEHTNYNSRLQPEQIGLGTSGTDSSTLRLDYTYGTTANNGNVQTQRIVITGSLDVTQNYTYDELNRLKTANESSGANWSQTYGYDRFGNRWVSASTGYALNTLTPQVQSAFTAGNNRLVASVYDTAGNQTMDGQSRSFEYDGENRQTKFNSTVGQYFYDGDGRRVKKIDSTGTTVFVYNAGGQLIAEYHSDPVPPAAGGGGTSYLTSDHLGSTRVVTKSDGTVKARYDYLPFGEEIPSTIGVRGSVGGYSGADSTRQKFTQKERDNESGLDYFLARYYSSAQGRFTSPDEFTGGPDELYSFAEDASDNPTFYADIFQPQSLNKYQYCLNNPLAYVDPDGHQGHQITRALERAAQTPAGQEVLKRAAQAGTAVTAVLSGAAEKFLDWASKNNTSGDASQPAASNYVENYTNRKQAEKDAQQTKQQDKGGQAADPGGDKKPVFDQRGTQTTTTREVTPGTNSKAFEPVKGSPAKRNKETGEIWVKDRFHKDHYEVYKNQKKFENGKRNRSVWEDGRPKEKL
ncbi:MAG: RHS repeat-associated core domain-containing protein [Acidobacteriota bacterium]